LEGQLLFLRLLGGKANFLLDNVDFALYNWRKRARKFILHLLLSHWRRSAAPANHYQ